MHGGFASKLRQHTSDTGWTFAVARRYKGAVACGAAQQGCSQRCSVTTNTFELPPCRSVVPAEVVQVLPVRFPAAPNAILAPRLDKAFWRTVDTSICNF
jgi:hypothetical protein